MKEKIIEKIEELKKNKAGHIAQVNACNGAIEVLEQLLKEDAKSEPQKEGENGNG